MCGPAGTYAMPVTVSVVDPEGPVSEIVSPTSTSAWLADSGASAMSDVAVGSRPFVTTTSIGSPTGR